MLKQVDKYEYCGMKLLPDSSGKYNLAVWELPRVKEREPNGTYGLFERAEKIESKILEEYPGSIIKCKIPNIVVWVPVKFDLPK